MFTLGKLLIRPIRRTPSAGQVAQCVLTGCGILGLILGFLKLPSLVLSEAALFGAILQLVTFMLVAYAAGQLAVIAEELKQTRKDRAPSTKGF